MQCNATVGFVLKMFSCLKHWAASLLVARRKTSNVEPLEYIQVVTSRLSAIMPCGPSSLAGG
jgi:hypothetical protein